MRREEFKKLRIGDIVKWGHDADYSEHYTLLIKELNIQPSGYHLRHHQGIVLSYSGLDINLFLIGQKVNLYEKDHRSIDKVA